MKTVEPGKEIGFFCAIPLTRDEFEHDLSRAAPNGDYVKNVLCDGGSCRPEIAWYTYQPIAEFIKSKMEQLRSLGVDVYKRATTALCRDLLGHYQAAILLAHWKGARVYPCDLPLPDELGARLLNGPDAEIGFLRELVGFDSLEAVAFAINRGDRTELLSRLCSVLNNLVEDYDLAPEREIEDAAARNRDHLVRIFMHLLQPGNGVEFVDRLVSADDFTEIIAESYSGVLDCTICHSTQLANVMARKRRKCICISNQEEASPGFRMMRLVAARRIMLERKIDYLRALSLACDLFDEQILSQT